MSLGRVKRGQKEETKERNWQKDKREITQRHGLKLKKTEGEGKKETFNKVTWRQRIKSERKIVNETKRDIGQLFLPVSKRLQTAVDERAALYGAILSALALAIALRLTTQRSVLKVRRGTRYHRPQLRTHTHTHMVIDYSTLTQAFLCTDGYKRIGTNRHKYTVTYKDTTHRTRIYPNRRMSNFTDQNTNHRLSYIYIFLLVDYGNRHIHEYIFLFYSKMLTRKILFV